MQLKLTSVSVALLGLIKVVSACLVVDFVYNNDQQSITWLTVHDNNQLVMSRGLAHVSRQNATQVALSTEVAGWVGAVRNDGWLGWTARLTTPAGIDTGYFGLTKTCSEEGGANGCRVYWVSGKKFC